MQVVGCDWELGMLIHVFAVPPGWGWAGWDHYQCHSVQIHPVKTGTANIIDRYFFPQMVRFRFLFINSYRSVDLSNVEYERYIYKQEALKCAKMTGNFTITSDLIAKNGGDSK